VSNNKTTPHTDNWQTPYVITLHIHNKCSTDILMFNRQTEHKKTDQKTDQNCIVSFYKVKFSKLSNVFFEKATETTCISRCT